MTYGEALHRVRKSKRINQGDLAKRVGITQSYLSQIERGKKNPTINTLTDISKELNVPLGVIMWLSVSEKDVSENKKEAYNKLKPTFDVLVSDLFGL